MLVKLRNQFELPLHRSHSKFNQKNIWVFGILLTLGKILHIVLIDTRRKTKMFKETKQQQQKILNE